ncbi:MAG: CoA transferase, partial [Chloroflexi bacterium]|nr:CoA transferase [Chloroflexota bacterium]
MAATPAQVGAPAPHSGQHTAAVLNNPNAAWGTAAPITAAATTPRDASRPPLDGVLVLDFASWYAGPFAPSLLADLGARVIKIEPLEGDLFRHSGAGSLQHQLVAKADLVIHNFRPGAPARLGIDYATMRRINPRIVYLYAGAYGADGPSSHRPAFHPIAGAIAGGALYRAGQGTPPAPETPLSFEEMKEVSRRLGRANEANPDPNSAMIAATALLLGLYARERTGEGQEMLTTMVCSNGYANSDDFIQYAGKPERTTPDADGYGLSALYRLYRAGQGWVFLAAPRQREFERLCAALGQPAWAQDERFATPAARKRNDGALADLLTSAFAQRSADDWEAALTAQGVGCVRAD